MNRTTSTSHNTYPWRIIKLDSQCRDRCNVRTSSSLEAADLHTTCGCECI